MIMSRLPRLNRKTMPKEVVPLLAAVGTALTGGIYTSIHKLSTDPELRREGHQQSHPH
ncbi:hypothetical protein BX666DRAFT_2023105 [Dichotomocladium elegans]|nr:hypothetical protein BX666DRAFT_2023105 [Dichotomocladium elegans]